MKKVFPVFAAICAASLLAGCQTESADFYDLDEIRAYIDVDTVLDDRIGNSTEVSAQLKRGDKALTWLVLTSHDSFYVNVNGASGQELKEHSLLGVVTYDRSVHARQGDEISVTLDRPDDPAPAVSRVIIPDGIYEIGASADEFSRSRDRLVIDWMNPTDNLLADDTLVTVTGDCIGTSTWTIPNGDESVTIYPYDLESVSGYEADTCKIYVGVTKVRYGDFSREFREGYISASTSVLSDSIRCIP